MGGTRREAKRRIQEEAEKTGRYSDYANTPQHQSVTPGGAHINSRSTCQESLAGTLSGSGICTHGTKHVGRKGAQLHLKSRYVGISDFARQHIRTYATRSQKAPSVARAPKIARLASKQRSAQAIPSRANSLWPRQVPSKARAPTTTKSAPRLQPNHSPVRSSRLKALNLENFRLGALIRAREGKSKVELMEDGDYRSLRRRIINLTYYRNVLLDLSSLDAPPKHLATFAALDRNVYASIQKFTNRIHIVHHSFCQRWSEQIFHKVSTGGSRQILSNWMALDAETRKALFTPMLIYLLDKKPGRAIGFVQTIANDPQLHGTTTILIADALGHLSKVHKNGIYTAKQGWPANTTKIAQDFGANFVHIYRRSLVGHKRICPQDLLYNMATLAKVEDLRKVLDCLIDGKAFMNFDTLLHYASTFAQAGDTEYAFRCLQELKATFTDTRWSKVVSTLR